MASNAPLGTTQQALINTDTSIGESSSDNSLELFLLNLHKQEEATIAAEERIAKAKKLLLEGDFKQKFEDLDRLYAEGEERDTARAELERKLDAETINLARKMEDNFYRYSSKEAKRQMKEQQQATLRNGKEAIKQKMLEAAADKHNKNITNKELRSMRADYIKASQEEIAIEGSKRALIIAEMQEKRKYGITTKQDLEENFELISQTYEEERKGHEQNIGFLNEQIKLLEQKKEDGGLSDDENGEINKEIEELKSQRDDEQAAAKDSDKARFKEELLANIMKAGFKGMEQGLSKLGDTFGRAMDNAINEVGQYKSVFDARLQGTQSSYDSVAKTLKKSLAISPYAKQTEVLKKLNDAVDKGIAYNVEQRAFLATMTDKIVATFDAFDANLMRIIRLQQADTTAARMGMESNLLQFFNSTFSDNSYLTEGYDSVSQALIDANAQMSRDMSISFEFNVQKWLGSLASLGFGTDTITTIAQGINSLGSGNVTALAGNTQLQNLMAMSASRAGLSYSELLVKGIDDSSVNTLLKSMVEYLAEIAKDNNKVVKAAYGDVFNFTQSDLQAIENIVEGDTIDNIYKQSMTFSRAVGETQNQLNQMISRLSMNEMIDNVFENFLYSAGESLASDPISALMWRTISTIEDVTGGIEIPFVNIHGFGLDLNMSVESLLKTGMFGLSAIAQVPSMVTSLFSGGGMDLGIWGGTEYVKRGGDFDARKGGAQSSKSGSKAFTSAASSDTKKAALSSTEEDQEEQKKKSKESMSDEITIETLYKELFEKKTLIYVKDTPILNKMETVITATNTVKSRATDIHNILKDNSSKDPMYVSVTNMPAIDTESLTPKETVSIGNIDKLADAIGNRLMGGEIGKDEGNDGIATLSDIANILLNGVLKVRDEATLDQMVELNKNINY